jgi:hypothetical protein
MAADPSPRTACPNRVPLACLDGEHRMLRREIGIPEGVGRVKGSWGSMGLMGVSRRGRFLGGDARRRRGRGQGWPEASPGGGLALTPARSGAG